MILTHPEVTYITGCQAFNFSSSALFDISFVTSCDGEWLLTARCHFLPYMRWGGGEGCCTRGPHERERLSDLQQRQQSDLSTTRTQKTQFIIQGDKLLKIRKVIQKYTTENEILVV